ncbi:hypothetical protein [Streptomyces sp. NPDC057438]|uniref:hypothetical protein n=1 Tax=Streptomyces sp. NPDC057438 TaxID=3346133 RepID=UPI003695BA82
MPKTVMTRHLPSTAALRVPHIRVFGGPRIGEDPPVTNKPRPLTWGFIMERVTRIELALSAWEAAVIWGWFGC